jgi:hypothetical protein
MTMKAAYPLLFVTAMAASAIAQDLSQPTDKETLSDSVQKAIDEFNRLKTASKTADNEVIVVLDPPAPTATPLEKGEIKTPEAPAEIKLPEESPKDSKPILVTGTPPEEAQPEEQEPVAPEIMAEAETVSQDPATPSEPELEVRVESIRKGSGSIDPAQVKLKASFPAKPLSGSPDGWILEKSEQAPVFRKDVELQPGTTISLSIKPHILSPESDGINTFSVAEPGFDASQGYLQKNTVSAILSNSVAKLDNDSLQLGNAISELQRLLGSLPKTEEPKKP